MNGRQLGDIQMSTPICTPTNKYIHPQTLHLLLNDLNILNPPQTHNAVVHFSLHSHSNRTTFGLARKIHRIFRPKGWRIAKYWTSTNHEWASLILTVIILPCAAAPQRPTKSISYQPYPGIAASRRHLPSLPLTALDHTVRFGSSLVWSVVKGAASYAKRGFDDAAVNNAAGRVAIACSPIMGTTVTEGRLRKRGYTPFLEYCLQVKYGDVSNPKKR